MTVSAGAAGDLDRETILHVGAAAQHRLGGRHAASLAIWLTPLATGFDLETVAELVARGVVEGSFDPKTLYHDHDAVATAPPVLDELIARRPRRGDPRRSGRPRNVARSSAEGAEPREGPLESGGERHQPGGPRRRGPCARRQATASGSTSSSPIAPASSAWGCSSRSARAATTRRG